MYIHKIKYFKFSGTQIWYPDSIQTIREHLDQTPVVVLWQCPVEFVDELSPWTFRTKPFHTPLIDLTPSEDQLLQNLHRTSCRKEVRQALEMDIVVLRNEETEAARLLINESIRRLQYRDPVSEAAWNALLPNHDIFLCRTEDKTPLAVHVMLPDSGGRARPILSGTADRHDPQVRGMVGHANRLLHWQEILYYKSQGFQYYDFGGCSPEIQDKQSAEYAITQFKMSFGVKVVEEPMLYLAKNPALRTSLKMVSDGRNALRRLPWPQSWIKTVRSTPVLGDLFR